MCLMTSLRAKSFITFCLAFFAFQKIKMPCLVITVVLQGGLSFLLCLPNLLTLSAVLAVTFALQTLAFYAREQGGSTNILGALMLNKLAEFRVKLEF